MILDLLGDREDWESQEYLYDGDGDGDGYEGDAVTADLYYHAGDEVGKSGIVTNLASCLECAGP